ncbi:hydantoinase B/oxoprolinase family protein [Pseudooceanicola nanhaiensis]|uniref:hydantoinase B/oxoprolinase family protein n=1 Tax=Pseudooceanicola nanhaiensis TaxID=375761 RepID=UPI001CD3264E|nr:hydantoinase B/oxoprolinase family protein [Pseudooceanicola nanhaiensis]MCA0919967.1 hydantoinase B/oxoprolinase family protein [Pseudooceanicola nanhaiensis]
MTHDPLTFQILWDRLLSLVEEQARVLVRTAFCSTVREAEDLSFGLFDRAGAMVAQAATGTPGHVNAMAATVVHFLDRFPLETMKPGDHFMTNDPWLASGHRHDLTLVSPVFHAGRAVALIASTCHQVDIGGRGQTADGTSVFEEGFALPIMRICTDGQLHEDIRLILRENVRHPDQVEGDVLSMITAGETAAAGLCALMTEFGLTDIDALSAGILARTEAATRAAIAKCPDGTWSDSLTLDGFGAPITLNCRLTIAGDSIHADFEGSAPALPRGVNLVLNYTAAYAAYGIKCVVSPELPNNAGALAPIRVSAPIGSVLNVERPAPVAARHIIGQFLPELVMNCLAKAMPGVVPADGASCVWTAQLRGQVEGQPFDAVFFNAGGMGARHALDGLDATGFPSGIRATASEVVEAIAPIVIWRKDLAMDSGGPGRMRGGLGQVVEVGTRDGSPFTVFALYDRIDHAARGREGGTDGAAGAAWLKSGQPLAGLGQQEVPAGDRLCLSLPGGAGLGTPESREPAAVARDVADGRISAESAQRDYRVVLTPGGDVDDAATRTLRGEAAT